MREDVRKRIDNRVLWLFREKIHTLYFPMEPQRLIERLPDTRLMTYADLAAVGKCSLEDVCRACHSTDGSTQYDRRRNRYLVLINEDGRSTERIRWTTAHELGHILSGHFLELKDGKMLWPCVPPGILRHMEEEADYFAASFLAPFPALQTLDVQSPEDISEWVGLSRSAAERRWAEYNKAPMLGGELSSIIRWNGVVSRTKKTRIVRKPGIDIWMDEGRI